MSPVQEDTLLGLLALGLAFTQTTTTVAEATSLLSTTYKAEALA
ncbi:MAG: hypothetical protein R3E39_05980 [Anaerolineae bacterium]